MRTAAYSNLEFCMIVREKLFFSPDNDDIASEKVLIKLSIKGKNQLFGEDQCFALHMGYILTAPSFPYPTFEFPKISMS